MPGGVSLRFIFLLQLSRRKLRPGCVFVSLGLEVTRPGVAGVTSPVLYISIWSTEQLSPTWRSALALLSNTGRGQECNESQQPRPPITDILVSYIRLLKLLIPKHYTSHVLYIIPIKASASCDLFISVIATAVLGSTQSVFNVVLHLPLRVRNLVVVHRVEIVTLWSSL